ncbi:MAG: hypothetical protein Kow00109_25480 [Acidobacteriota bacterium]
MAQPAVVGANKNPAAAVSITMKLIRGLVRSSQAASCGREIEVAWLAAAEPRLLAVEMVVVVTVSHLIKFVHVYYIRVTQCGARGRPGEHLEPARRYTRPVRSPEGRLSIRLGDTWYSLEFPTQGWLSVILLQFLDEVYAAKDPREAVIRWLGYTLQIGRERPPRSGSHWVEVDFAARVVESNSPVLRAVVGRGGRKVEAATPWSETDLRRVYRTLDRLDFTVRLARR